MMTAISKKIKGVRSLIPATQLLTQDDLVDFKKEILTEFKRIIKESMGDPGKRWLKSDEVKGILCISHRFLKTLRDRDTLPF